MDSDGTRCRHRSFGDSRKFFDSTLNIHSSRTPSYTSIKIFEAIIFAKLIRILSHENLELYSIVLIALLEIMIIDVIKSLTLSKITNGEVIMVMLHYICSYIHSLYS